MVSQADFAANITMEVRRMWIKTPTSRSTASRSDRLEVPLCMRVEEPGATANGADIEGVRVGEKRKRVDG
jgi:hypothetical protein